MGMITNDDPEDECTHCGSTVDDNDIDSIFLTDHFGNGHLFCDTECASVHAQDFSDIY